MSPSKSDSPDTVAASLAEMRSRLEQLERANQELRSQVARQETHIGSLRASEGRLRAVMDTAVDGIIIIDELGQIESFNPAAEEIFGYCAEEMVGENVARLMPEPHRSQHSEYMARYLYSGVPRIIGTGREMVGQRQDGTVFPVHVALSEVESPLEDRRFFAGIVRDITAAKSLEAQLRQAKEAAEAASQYKSEFLANTSHELRTPLNGVIGMVQLLLDADPADEQRKFLELAEGSAVDLLAQINDLLDLSKIEAGRLELEAVEFDLGELLSGALAPLEVQARGKDLELTRQTGPQVPRLLVGDPVYLRRIIVNLVGNALKFTAVGRVSLETEVEEKQAGRICLRFSVRDTGIGIGMDEQKVIFDPFSQADSSTTRLFGGTGLGLSIANRLVEMMDGRLWVDSEVSSGSTFYFTAWFGLLEGDGQAVARDDRGGYETTETEERE